MSIFRGLQQSFKIKRDGNIMPQECHGTYGKNNTAIIFDYDSDIKKGDMVIDSHETYVITKIITHKAEAFPKDMWHLEAYIQTEDEYNRLNETTNTFHMNNCSISGAVQNNQGNIVINNSLSLDDLRKLICEKGADDKKELYKIVDELEKAESFEIYKKGLLGKFNDLLNKYSWLSGAIASYIIPKLFEG